MRSPLVGQVRGPMQGSAGEWVNGSCVQSLVLEEGLTWVVFLGTDGVGPGKSEGPFA